VRPGRLLAGEYPGDGDAAVAQRRLRTHLDCGVTFFLDLTEADELVPYESALPALTAEVFGVHGGGSFENGGRSVRAHSGCAAVFVLFVVKNHTA